MTNFKKLPKLTKSSKGKDFELGKFLINVNIAKSFIWSEQKDRTEQKDFWISLHQLKRKSEHNDKMLRAICMIIGPFKLMIGWSDK